jgi:hypothetical protein
MVSAVVKWKSCIHNVYITMPIIRQIANGESDRESAGKNYYVQIYPLYTCVWVSLYACVWVYTVVVCLYGYRYVFLLPAQLLSIPSCLYLLPLLLILDSIASIATVSFLTFLPLNLDDFVFFSMLPLVLSPEHQTYLTHLLL